MIQRFPGSPIRTQNRNVQNQNRNPGHWYQVFFISVSIHDLQ